MSRLIHPRGSRKALHYLLLTGMTGCGATERHVQRRSAGATSSPELVTCYECWTRHIRGRS